MHSYVIMSHICKWVWHNRPTSAKRNSQLIMLQLASVFIKLTAGNGNWRITTLSSVVNTFKILSVGGWTIIHKYNQFKRFHEFLFMESKMWYFGGSSLSQCQQIPWAFHNGPFRSPIWFCPLGLWPERCTMVKKPRKTHYMYITCCLLEDTKL